MVTPLVRLRAALSQLRCDRRGATAIVFALALIPLCLAGGSAVDMGRAYLVKNRLGYALDAAGLAVGSATTSDEAELQAIMLAYFAANYPGYELGTTATPTMSIDDKEISLSATAVVDTTLMNVIGIHEMTVAANTLIVRETKGLDVVLVLDNTGSMGTTKMNSLKSASHTFLDILYGDDTESDLLQVGVVPFSTTVNVGTGFADLTSGYSASAYSPYAWTGCVMARGSGRDVTDDPPTSNATRWDAFLWPDDSNNNWSGWNSGPPATPNRYCPVELLPLTGIKSDIDDKIDEMSSAGNTHINYGLVWGWRVLSPTAPFTEGHDYDDEDYVKSIVLMTDGENVMSSSVFTAYGYLSQGKLGTTSSSSNAVDELNDRTTDVCDNIKDEGIILYTITFQVTSNSIRDLMRNCASEDDNYFDSPSDAELEAAFRAIGQELSNLRIGR
jgi:Flp pilus assembly protein TadG